MGSEIERVAAAWSGGKDSAMAVYELLRAGQVRVATLLTTITKEPSRISVHGVRRELLRQQGSSLGIPVREVKVGAKTTNEQYERSMGEAMKALRDDGISRVAFGDLFLRDIRSYRERQLSKLAMEPLFPLWLRDTKELASEFIRLGFRAHVVCVDSTQMNPTLVGSRFDEKFLGSLPESVDPCGENGEFHTFVFDGPCFSCVIPCETGREHVSPDGRFWFRDLLPLDS
jgi:uncharacterized protein (TIGR00290 family)